MAVEVTQLARQMEQYLISHDKAAKQILILDEQIQQINKRTLKAEKDGCSMRATHLMLRRSVAEGVRDIYQEYRIRKWQELQKFVKEVISRLQPDGVDVQSPDFGNVTVDRTQTSSSPGWEENVRQYADNFCSMLRKS